MGDVQRQRNGNDRDEGRKVGHDDVISYHQRETGRERGGGGREGEGERKIETESEKEGGRVGGRDTERHTDTDRHREG